MNSKQDTLLNKIQEMEFVAIDLHLYLDTHPCDADALNDYNCAVDMLRKYMLEYENTCGAIIANGHHGGNGQWDWIDNPWPWEM